MTDCSTSAALARASDPRESHVAAASVNAATLAEAVLSALDGKDMTTGEIAKATAIPLVSVSPRMRPLELAGKVRRTGERRNGSAVWSTSKQN